MIVKIQILTQCEDCEGEAYLPAGEADSNTGETYMRYEPCSKCQGSARQTKWVSLREFADLLERANSFEPDYAALAQEQPTSQYQDSRDAAGI